MHGVGAWRMTNIIHEVRDLDSPNYEGPQRIYHRALAWVLGDNPLIMITYLFNFAYDGFFAYKPLKR